MNYKHKLFLSLFIIFAFSINNCRDRRKEKSVTEIVREWIGKEILFPENLPCFVLGKETLPEVCRELFQKEYKIFRYIDSTGCSSCELKLTEWKKLIEETDGLFPGKVGFVLYFQPKSMREMYYLFMHEKFNHPVFIDTIGIINHLNEFPKKIEYQCFLLNSDNKVLAIGNPVSKLNIWELYKSLISGGKISDPVLMTTAKIDKTKYLFGCVRNKSINTAVFKVLNTGNHPLVISRVSVTCGCVKANWDEQPLKPGETTTIQVEMTPDETGHFIKTIAVYCNTNDSPLRLTVSGTTIE